MKVKHFLLACLAVAFLSSAIPFDKQISIGDNAPKIVTSQGADILEDEISDKKNKVISFWNPKIPASRIANRELCHKYGNHNQQVDFISICTDPDEGLMNEVLKIDGLENLNAFSYSEISPRAFKDYGAESNPKAFLISPEGKILNIL